MKRELLRGLAIMLIATFGILFTQPLVASEFRLHGDKAQSAPHHKQRRHTNAHSTSKRSRHHGHSN